MNNIKLKVHFPDAENAQDKEFQTEKRGSMIQESWSSSKRTRGATSK